MLAAANPVYGRYNPFKTPMENIGLQDSLLSRFDCLFIMLDTIDVDSDRKIADHVVKVHQYRDGREADGAVTVIQAGASELATHSNEAEGKVSLLEFLGTIFRNALKLQSSITHCFFFVFNQFNGKKLL